MLAALVISLLLNPGNEALPILKRDNPSPPSALSTFTSTRSLYNIIWSCAVTTFLCAWISIHLNTLPKQGGPWEKVGLRVRFLLLTIFAPELVIGWASMERTSARRIKDGFRKEGVKISMTHAHLIRMGSFALCLPEAKVRELATIKDREFSKPIVEEVPELLVIGDELRRAMQLNEENPDKAKKDDEKGFEAIPKNDTQIEGVVQSGNEEIQEISRNNEELEETSMNDKELLIVDDDTLVNLRYIETLTARRFLNLLRQPNPSIRFPVITTCELKDRSKTDALAKFITAVQVLWFVVQCIVRHVEGLAITQLELTTLALASLNAYMLWLWQDKPQSVDVQIPVYLVEHSEEWEKKWEQRKAEIARREEEGQKNQEEEKDVGIFRRPLVKLWPLILVYWNGFSDGFFGRNRQLEEVENEEDSELDQGPLPDNFMWAFEKGYRWADDVPLWVGGPIIVAGFLLMIPILLSVLIIGAGIVLSEIVLAMLVSSIVPLLFKSRRLHTLLKDRLLSHRARLLGVWTALDYASQALYVGTAFGGLHLAGWNFAFPTTTEQTLWRVMSLILAITPVVSFVCAVNFEATSTSHLLGFSISHAFLFGLTVFSYTIARLCIVALALALLRNQPATAFLAVVWTKLFPHA